MLSKEQIQFFEEGYLIIKNYIQDLNIDYNLIPKEIHIICMLLENLLMIVIAN